MSGLRKLQVGTTLIGLKLETTPKVEKEMQMDKWKWKKWETKYAKAIFGDNFWWKWNVV